MRLVESKMRIRLDVLAAVLLFAASAAFADSWIAVSQD